jgi:hypothetical protein
MMPDWMSIARVIELITAILAAIIWMAVAHRMKAWRLFFPVILWCLTEATWHVLRIWFYPEYITVQALNFGSLFCRWYAALTFGMLGVYFFRWAKKWIALS